MQQPELDLDLPPTMRRPRPVCAARITIDLRRDGTVEHYGTAAWTVDGDVSLLTSTPKDGVVPGLALAEAYVQLLQLGAISAQR